MECKTLDKIIITDLIVRGIIGINDWERVQKQDINLNFIIYSDLKHSGKTDDIEDTLNYKTLSKAIIAYVEGSKHFLVETLATNLARMIILDFDIERVVVKVEKPGALRFTKTVGVEIDRVRSDFDE
jgi:FolB domain-containing protein